MSEEKKTFCDAPTLNVLVANIEEQVERGVCSTLLVPDWSSFKTTVARSEHKLVENEDSYGFRFHISNLIHFKVTQSLYWDDYQKGSPALGFGFKNFECLECGHSDLLYDEEEEVRYCPKHG